MPRKTRKIKKIQPKEDEVILEETPLTDTEEETVETPKKGEPIDFAEYVTEPNIKLGTDYRRKITFEMDNKEFTLAIRPLSDEEINQIHQRVQMGEGSLYTLVAHTASYGLKGKQIPLTMFETKIVGGVTMYIATEILKISGYYMDEESTQFLKKL